jgi:hypothetical protein
LSFAFAFQKTGISPGQTGKGSPVKHDPWLGRVVAQHVSSALFSGGVEPFLIDGVVDFCETTEPSQLRKIESGFTSTRPPFSRCWLEYDIGWRGFRAGWLVEELLDGRHRLSYFISRPAGTFVERIGVCAFRLGDETPYEISVTHQGSRFQNRVESSIGPRDTGLCLRSAVGGFRVFCGLLSCRNITTAPAEISRPARRRDKRAPVDAVEATRYRVLHIELAGRGQRSIASPGPTEELRALHLVRGHAVHYTEDAPMFGRLVGTYWRSPHLRGSAEAGAVVKVYSLDERAALGRSET